MRARVTTLSFLTAVLVLALPSAGHSQSPTTMRGAFTGPVSAETTVGTLRGSVPSGATIGAGRGSAGVDSVGATRGSVLPGGTVGALRSAPVAGSEVPALPGTVIPPATGAVRGAVPTDATVGAVGTPIPADTSFGEPGPRELAARLDSLARTSLVDGNYAQATSLLNRSVAIREQMVGAVHPDVAEVLESNAMLLRHWNLEAAAADMDARAKEIRTKLETPAPPPGESF